MICNRIIKPKNNSSIDDFKKSISGTGPMEVIPQSHKWQNLIHKETFKKNNTSIVLSPANDLYESKSYNSSRIIIQGILTGIIRKY